MIGISIALAVLAVALAWPVPILLAHAQWPARAPATALVLWQAIALAGGLSMLGSLITFGLAPFGQDLIDGGISFAAAALGDQPWSPAGPVHILALSAAVLLGGHLVLNLLVTIVRAERDRRRHAQLVLLLSTPLPDAPGTRLLDSPAPVAYCLPGAFTTMTVLSAGLLSLLKADELDAVIEHEKAHATQRHDIVLMAFRAWKASLPWFPIAHRAHREVGLLVEMLADDQARRSVDDRALARAIALVSTGAPTAPLHPIDGTWSGAAPAGEARHRILRLETRPLPTEHKATVIGAAMGLLIMPTVLLLAPGLTDLLGRA
ncbi:M56 family metallopeptidase [Kocuria sp. U4B]